MPTIETAERGVGRQREAGGCVPLPVVSVIVANFNGARYLEDCLTSTLGQTVEDLEVIVIDDGSTDDSVDIVRRRAGRDSRVRLLETGGRHGPGAARNLGLGAAKGEWIAVLDSDDIMHPRRLADLIGHAGRSGADIVADNQIVFDDDGVEAARALLTSRELPGDRDVSASEYIDSNRLFSRATPLGYLKPVFSHLLIERTSCRYDPSLLIAEDYDFVLRLLLSGAHLRVCPQLTYFYRRHSSSISHRLSRRTLLPMLAADDALRYEAVSSGRPLHPSLVRALDGRRRSITTAIGFEDLVGHLRARRWGAALALCAAHPAAAGLLRIPLRDRLLKMVRPTVTRAEPGAGARRITLLSRQRIVGTTNGSSAYLLSLCAFLRQAGFELDLVSPSPAMFGRWPYLRLKPEMDVFSSIRFRGALRFGRFVVARDPRIAVRAAAGLADRWLSRAGIHLGGLGGKAPHSIAVPLTDDDRLFVANATRPSALLLVDYAFLTETIPFAMQPGTASAVVMHDLFSSQNATRSVVRLDRSAEIALLAQADAVITIQAAESEIISRDLPDTRVILAPMAVETVAAAQPGESGTALFVGSNTLPNIDGINWFVAEVWPEVMKRRPASRLRIAGSCCGGIAKVGEGIELLGRVDDLAPLYARAGVVVSPLREGSGLKIKLVEALGHGKAVIATETTLQGVKSLLAGAVLQADTAAEFTRALETVLEDRTAREGLGERALQVARRHFSTDACYAGLLEYIRLVGCADHVR